MFLQQHVKSSLYIKVHASFRPWQPKHTCFRVISLIKWGKKRWNYSCFDLTHKQVQKVTAFTARTISLQRYYLKKKKGEKVELQVSFKIDMASFIWSPPFRGSYIDKKFQWEISFHLSQKINLIPHHFPTKNSFEK